MSGLPIYVYLVDMPDGEQHFVSCLAPEQAAAKGGIPPEAIIGRLTRTLEPGEAITPDVFARNSVFVDFMHGVIARRGPEMADLVVEARRQRKGWVYVIDQRTPTPQGDVPSEDIVGAFEVTEGKVSEASYQRFPEHRILTTNGFVQLGPEMERYLLEELVKRSVGSTAPD